LENETLIEAIYEVREEIQRREFGERVTISLNRAQQRFDAELRSLQPTTQQLKQAYNL